MMRLLKDRNSTTNRKPRAVRALRLGYNPNSSSLGISMTLLVWGSMAVAILAPVAAGAVRLFVHKDKAS